MDGFVKHPQLLKPYIMGGNSTFTIYSDKLKKRYTYHVVRDKSLKSRYIVSLFYGSDNVDFKGSYRFLGIFYDDTMTLNVNSIGDYKRDAAKMLDYFLGIVSNKHTWPQTCEFYPSKKCARCGRTLTTPESVKRGIGPDCLEALGSSGKQWNLDFDREK